MAEALNTITAPIKHRARVTPNIFRSGCKLSGISSLSAFRRRAPRLQWLSSCDNKFLEHAAALLVIFKLIETRTCRREQDDISRLRELDGQLHGAVKRVRLTQGDALRQDLTRFFPRPLRSEWRGAPRWRKGLAQRRVGTAFILAAENHDQRPGKASTALRAASTLVAFESL